MQTRMTVPSRQTGPRPALPKAWGGWRILLEVALSLGVTGGAIFGVFNWAIGAAVHRRPEVMVPDLTNKPLPVVLELLRPLNLSLQKEGEEFHQTLPPGVVIRQIPSAGLMVREGKAVRVVISQGGRTLFLPDVVGRPLRSAELLFRQAGFGLGEIANQPSLRFGKDLVMSQEPSAGGVADKGTLVNLMISAGLPPPGMVLAPDLIGKPIEEAEGWAKTQQFPLQILEVNQAAAPPDRIVAQLPLPDTIMTGAPGGLSPTVIQVTVNRAHPAIPPGPRIYFELPQGASDRDVRIVIVDQLGEREIYHQRHAPGSKIDLPVVLQGPGKARIFLDNTLILERPL